MLGSSGFNGAFEVMAYVTFVYREKKMRVRCWMSRSTQGRHWCRRLRVKLSKKKKLI